MPSGKVKLTPALAERELNKEQLLAAVAAEPFRVGASQIITQIRDGAVAELLALDLSEPINVLRARGAQERYATAILVFSMLDDLAGLKDEEEQETD